jgi:hypothetical protein
VSYRFSRLTKQLVRFTVTHKVAGVVVDPTADVVEFAFLPPPAEPAGGDWTAGTWETIPGPPVQYVARCLVGPATGGGGKVLARGDYVIWLRVTDAAEVPVKAVGSITIT